MVIVSRGAIWQKKGVWGEILGFWPNFVSISCSHSLLDLYWLSSWLYWMQNEILYTIQPIKNPTQIQNQTSAGYSSRIRSKLQYFGPNIPFYPMTLDETITIQYRIKFCIQNNQLNCQHSSDREYHRAILAERRRNPSISPQSLLFCSISSLESITIRWRI
jgi:hypothetical protein